VIDKCSLEYTVTFKENNKAIINNTLIAAALNKLYKTKSNLLILFSAYNFNKKAVRIHIKLKKISKTMYLSEK
jgi:hypothetical protein